MDCALHNPQKVITPCPNTTFDRNSPHEIKLLTRLQVRLSHLVERKLRHTFHCSLSPLCDCCWHMETTFHFLVNCSNHSNKKKLI